MLALRKTRNYKEPLLQSCLVRRSVLFVIDLKNIFVLRWLVILKFIEITVLTLTWLTRLYITRKRRLRRL